MTLHGRPLAGCRETFKETVRTSVFQDSVFGRFSYNSINNDLGKCLTEPKIAMFADDTTMHSSGCGKTDPLLEVDI